MCPVAAPCIHPANNLAALPSLPSLNNREKHLCCL